MTTRTPLVGGTWNMERDRDPREAAASALAMMRSRGMHFLCIQECAHYLHKLREFAGAEFDVIAFTDDPGRGESAIIVRADVDHSSGWQVRATRAGWVTVRGGTTPPKYLTIVKVDWLRVVCGHTAPSITWRAGLIIGPVRRVISMRQFARKVRRFVTEHTGPTLVACDWNATPAERGRFTPHWIARKTGMRTAAPEKPTHGSRVIDFALYRGAAVSARREKRRGSDHYAVVFGVRP